MRLITCLLLALCCYPSPRVRAQTPTYHDTTAFTRADTLRGALRPERTSFDVTYYELHLDVDPTDKYIEGRVDVHYDLLRPTPRIQLDLYENMDVDRIVQRGRALNYTRDGNAIFVDVPGNRITGRDSLSVYYSGHPTAARNAPWDGGFVWSRDQRARTWVGVACEGDGASLWWPNKDHLSDEPDSMLVSVTVPERLFVASNGNLRAEVELEDEEKKRYDWFVSYPINNYNISLGIGHYTHFDTTYVSFEGDSLALDYYVIDYNEQKARRQFLEVFPMLRAYEHYLGKYPFWDDGFALIETPYLGMEHQSGIAYGNRYMRGYLGGLIPDDMDWDYIIVHEAGHEYFGNSISVADHAELWIHESFTTYLEALYVEYHMGADAGARYLQTQKRFIQNQTPMLGPLDVNFTEFGSSDHYYKGAWMLHTLRHVLDDDELWFGLLRGFYQAHQRSIVSTRDVIDYFSEYTSRDLGPFFEQYLEHPRLPRLKLRYNGKKVQYRWVAQAEGFAMPVGLYVGEEYLRVRPNTEEWQTLPRGSFGKEIRVVDDFLVELWKGRL